jgi:signal transduction histidine kinase
LIQFKHPYLITILIAFVSGVLLIGLLFSSALYFKAAIIIVVPIVITAFGYRFTTNRRIREIRNQLFQILQTLEEFDVDEPKKITFKKSPFPVFNELNEYLIELIDRVRTNYIANKQFTQNASHELQTPLAIIKGHIELLLQLPNIKEKEYDSLGIILQNIDRLSKLNNALILLSKIENHRFSDTQKIDFNHVINNVLNNFHDLIRMKDLKINTSSIGKFEVNMSETLAEILVANLVQNAIRHNLENGFIEIRINEKSFHISNPGNPIEVAPESMFKRFKRNSNLEESLGLGLSIVKRICEQFELEISYVHEGGIHTLKCQSKA